MSVQAAAYPYRTLCGLDSPTLTQSLAPSTLSINSSAKLTASAEVTEYLNEKYLYCKHLKIYCIS